MMFQTEQSQPAKRPGFGNLTPEQRSEALAKAKAAREALAALTPEERQVLEDKNGNTVKVDKTDVGFNGYGQAMAICRTRRKNRHGLFVIFREVIDSKGNATRYDASTRSTRKATDKRAQTLIERYRSAS